MVGRTLSRSTPSRDQASSPPKKLPQRANKSPTPPVWTRVTRSASRDLDSDQDNRTRKTARPRSGREGSTESLDSNGSNGSKGGRRHKDARVATSIAHDLSVVVEEQEKELAQGQLADAIEKPQFLQSPGGLSRLSGATALTTQSAQKMDDFDVDMMVELLPDLSRETFRLVELLIPSSVSPDTVESIINELRVPGSGRGKRLRLREKTFQGTTENYGNDFFIDPFLVLRRLFDQQELGSEKFRPDDVLHAANIATMVKELLVAQPDKPNTTELLKRLDDVFPIQFLSGYSSDPKVGSSALLQASIDLALDLRTQTAISSFHAYQHETNYDPYQLLVDLFYEPPEHPNELLSTSEGFMANGRLREIAGFDSEQLPIDDQVPGSNTTRLRQRVMMLYDSFLPGDEDMGDGAYVDFFLLDDRFPWKNFLAHVVRWSQLRLDEIRKSIEAQGGIENIANLLSKQIKGSNKQIELDASVQGVDQELETLGSKTDLHPTLPIIPATAGKRLYKSSESVLALVGNSRPNSSFPLANQQYHSATPRDKSTTVSPTQALAASVQGPSRNIHASRLQTTANLLGEPTVDIQEHTSDSGESSIAEVIAIYRAGELHAVKENRPMDGHGGGYPPKGRFIDRQQNPKRISFEDDDSGHQIDEIGQDAYLVRHEDGVVDGDEEDDDDDEAFQSDIRPVDISRRGIAAIPVASAHILKPPPQLPPKRPLARLQENEDDELPAPADIRPRKRKRLPRQEPALDEELNEHAVLDEALQASARAADELSASSVRKADEPSAFYSSIAETARASVATISSRLFRGPQKRTFWSDDESARLIELIARFGSNWSRIEQVGQEVFSQAGRGQVALKDKARNMKVNYLLCGTNLPCGFDAIALGKKERDKVKAAGINPYRLEDEAVGFESHDMDGNKV